MIAFETRAGLQPLMVAVIAADPVRAADLSARVALAGHMVVEAVIGDTGVVEPGEAELVLADADSAVPAELPVLRMGPGGAVPTELSPVQLDAALRAIAAGLRVSLPSLPDGFAAAECRPLLTPRELEILACLGEGLSNKAVARRLGISAHTVKFHLEAVFSKLGAGSRADAVARGLRGGLILL